LENLITGGVILTLTGKITGIALKKSLLVLSSILCGIYSFIIFWDTLGFWPALLLKLAFSIMIVVLAFQIKGLQKIFRTVLVFYLVSFSMGGITIGAMYFLGFSGVTQNSAVYLEGFTYFDVALGCVLTFITFSVFSDFIKGRLNRERTMINVRIELGGKKVSMKGMIDTGNFLRDPLTGKPVLIISAGCARNLMPPDLMEEAVKDEKTILIYENLMKGRYANRIRLIPYRSIGEEQGYLIGVRPDRILIEPKDKRDKNRPVIVPEGVILAIYKGIFDEKYSGDDCSILLHPSIIEGGVACDV